MRHVSGEHREHSSPSTIAERDRIIRELLADSRLWTPPTANLNPRLLDEGKFFWGIADTISRLESILGWYQANDGFNSFGPGVNRAMMREAARAEKEALRYVDDCVRTLKVATSVTWHGMSAHERLRATARALEEARIQLWQSSRCYARAVSAEQGRARTRESIADRIGERVVTAIEGLLKLMLEPVPPETPPRVDGHPNFRVIPGGKANTPDEPR